MKRPAVIIAAAIIGLIGLVGYFWVAPPADVEPMGDDDALTIAWSSLAVGIVGLATSVVGLIQKLFELHHAASKHV